jgi:hypothetical protein
MHASRSRHRTSANSSEFFASLENGHFAMREFVTATGWRRRAAIDGSLVVLLSLTGPFGTFVDLPWPLRLVYWALAVGGCSILMHVVIGALLSSEHLEGWPRLPRIALGAMLAALPGAAVIGLLETVMRHNDSVFDHYFWFWICVTLLGFPVAVIQFAGAQSPTAANPVEVTPGGRDVAFLRRLPREIGRDLISISMQDHYVHATTTRGSTMILIRFSDAVKELADYPGAQIHRSHWIAAGHARRLLRDGKRAMVELKDGRLLPVSRPYLRDARGLLDESE